MTILSADTGRPVANALVAIGSRQAVTDGAGRVSFPGLASGKTSYRVVALDHQDAVGTLSLADGRRDEVVVRMEPCRFVTWKGEVRAAIGDEVICGAKIRLIPKARGRWQTGVSVNSAPDGRFIIPRLCGDYTVQVTAPEFRPLRFELPGKGLSRYKKIRLQPVVTEKRVTVRVRECSTGRPLSGARISLFEAPESGVFGQAVTDGSGRAEATVHLARWTRSRNGWSTDGLQGRRAILRAAIQGAFAEIPVDLGRDQAFDICVDEAGKISESEPNNDPASAQQVSVFDDVGFRIGKENDVDMFRFTLEFPAYVEITTIYPGMELHAALQTGDARTITSVNSYRNKENRIRAVLRAGTYYYAVNEWGKNGKSEDEGVIRLRARSLSDAYEANDSLANATGITLPATIRARIGAVGDADFYVFHLDYPGLVRVRIPARKLEMSVTLLDDSGKEVHHVNSYANTPLAAEYHLDGGTYALRVQEWGNNGWNFEPYLLLADYFPDDDNRILTLDRPSGMGEALIQHLGDRDGFALNIPSAGHLQVRTHGILERTVEIVTPDKDVSANTYANTSSASTVDLDGPGPVSITIREWGDNGWSSSPIMLETMFLPADLYDVAGRNDTMATASPVQLGEEVHFSFNPTGDQDWFQLVIDQAGELELEIRSRAELTADLVDHGGRSVWRSNMYANTRREQRIPLLPGIYYLHLNEWGNNGLGLQEGSFRLGFVPADPEEKRGWTVDPPRHLVCGVARSLRCETYRDVDRFTFRAAEKGQYRLVLRTPVSGNLALDTGSGDPPSRHIIYANTRQELKLDLEAGQRIDLTFTGSNSMDGKATGFIVILNRNEEPVRAMATAVIDPLEPARVKFTCTANGADRIEILPMGRQSAPVPCPDRDVVAIDYPQTGTFTALVRGFRNGRLRSVLPVPVAAVGQPVLRGLHVRLTAPQEGSVIGEDLVLQASAVNHDGTGIRKVVFYLDERPVGTSYQPPYSLTLDRRHLNGGRIRLRAAAVDRSGRVVRSAPVTVRISPFFNLFPADNATVTSRTVRFSWQSDAGGEPGIEYRPDGESRWRSKSGICRQGRCQVTVEDMAWRQVYEFRARLGDEVSPVRRLTHVKGLAFTAPAYSANIRRDYDQSAVVTVQNAGDRPVVARLGCSRPDSRLLVGFVGEGSEDEPITLQPNERRSFRLGLSAQDVVRAHHTVHVYIESTDGSRSDQALVNVAVDLPRVDLAWQKLGPSASGLGSRFRLRNNGDPVTDLSLSVDRGFTLSPEISHGLLRSGQSLDVSVYPVLGDGFSGISGELRARAVGTTVRIPVEARLPAGKKIFLSTLIPGSAGEDELARLRGEMRALASAWLDPRSVRWSEPANPVDTNMDGRPDQWHFPSPDETVSWTGRDTDGDGRVDFATADAGADGIIDFAAYRTGDGWEQTNLVDAVLETRFSLPWSRESYQPHTVRLIYNDTVIGTISNRLPEGNFIFPIPPSAIHFDRSGRPEPGELKVETEHLRGGHYIVNNDYQLRTRMTGVTAWAAGATRQAAAEALRSYPGVAVSGPDYSVDTARLKISKAVGLKPGDRVRLSTIVANSGSSTTPAVEVALLRRSLSGGREQEITRRKITVPSLVAPVPVSFTWTATPGPAQLVVAVDPDGVSGDISTGNNEAIVVVEVAGAEKDLPPFEPVVTRPAGQGDGPEQIFEVRSAGVNITAATLTIDTNPATDLQAAGSTTLRVPVFLQPGHHRLVFRLTGADGRKKELVREVTVRARAPKLVITEPATDAVDQARVVIRAATDPRIALAAVRVAGQPWKRMKMGRGETKAELFLPHGRQTIEVMVVGMDGARAVRSITLFNRHRMTAAERQARDAELRHARAKRTDPSMPLGRRLFDQLLYDGRIAMPGGVIDAFGQADQVMMPPPQAPGDRPGGRQPAPRTVRQRSDKGRRTSAGGSAVAATPTPTGQEHPTAGQTGPAGEEQQFAVEPEVEVPPHRSGPGPGGSGTGRGKGGGPATAQSVTWPTASPTPVTGAAVTVTRKKHDWYCTNRPKIKNRFTLPDWVRRKKLPRPGTAEYDRLVKRYLAALRSRGYDTRAIERFQRYLIRMVSRLEQPGRLPGFLESIGFSEPKPEDPGELARWRQKMKVATQAWWVRLLSSGDPDTIVKGLKARAAALARYDEAAAEHAQAVIETIQASQDFAETVIESVPVAGELLDIYAVAAGTTALAGRQVSGLERGLRLLGLAAPGALKYAYEKSPAFRNSVRKIGQSLAGIGRAGRRRLAVALGLSEEMVDRAMRTSTRLSEEAAEQVSRKLDDQVDDAVRAFRNTDQGRSARQLWEKDVAQARELLKELETAGPGKFKEVALKIQRNKTAQGLINREVEPATREAYNRVMKTVYTRADEASAETLKRLATLGDDDLAREAGRLGISPGEAKRFRDKIQDIARKRGLSVDDLEIRGVDFTGNSASKVGRDRDVTFKVFDRQGNELADVHHDVSKNIYEQNFWKESTGKPLPVKDGRVDMETVSRHAEDLDQAVTSKWHPEAYATGNTSFEDFIRGGSIDNADAEAVAATYTYKVQHWFDRATRATSPVQAARDTAEGMRQVTKQWDRIVKPRLARYYGAGAATAVPVKLKKGLNIFRKVEAGTLTVAEADAALKAIGMSRESVLRQSSFFLEHMEKTAGRMHRMVGRKNLADAIGQIKAPRGSSLWLSRALATTNKAFIHHDISSRDFLTQRRQVFNSVDPSAFADRQALRRWLEAARRDRLISESEARTLVTDWQRKTGRGQQ